MHGTTRFSPLSISLKTGRPILAMMRMLTLMLAESLPTPPAVLTVDLQWR
jgi:hypothetical protein